MQQTFLRLMIFSALTLTLFYCTGDRFQIGKPLLASSKPVSLQKSKDLVLEASDKLVDVSQFQWLGNDRFGLLDKFVTHQAYVYGLDGQLVYKLGRPGQGPGEYRTPTGLAQVGNDYYLADLGGKLIVYSAASGEYVRQNYLTGNAAIAKGLYSLGENQLLLPIFSKYAEYSLYMLDEQGNVTKSFSKPEKVFGTVFDSFAPQGGVVLNDGKIFQFFNHRYEIKVFDFQGSPLETIRLASGQYLEPDFSQISKIKNSDQRKIYRSTFTQFVGLFRLKNGWVTLLRNWHDPKTPIDMIEVWDEGFVGVGRAQVPEGQDLVATLEDSLVFLEVGETHTKLLFNTLSASVEN